MITEFGWSLVRWENGQEIPEHGHFIVKEYRSYTNTYVPNHKEVTPQPSLLDVWHLTFSLC